MAEELILDIVTPKPTTSGEHVVNTLLADLFLNQLIVIMQW